VQNSATKGIQGMQEVSNLPISAWLLLADLNGGKTATGCCSKHGSIKLKRGNWKKISTLVSKSLASKTLTAWP